MDLFELKREFGERVSFQGAIDVQQALPGTLIDVENEVKARLRALAPGGGYILAPCNNVQEDIPPENLVRLYQYAREWGRYPINV
jgi:uroporphyrinogen decarboxylase